MADMVAMVWMALWADIKIQTLYQIAPSYVHGVVCYGAATILNARTTIAMVDVVLKLIQHGMTTQPSLLIWGDDLHHYIRSTAGITTKVTLRTTAGGQHAVSKRKIKTMNFPMGKPSTTY